MNDYNDYYKYARNYYDLSTYDRESHTTNMYEPYQGFIRGNSFKELYNKYKTNEPYEIHPNNEQAELLTRIDALEFSMLDLTLYLDLYPDDKNAIGLYNTYLNKYKEYKKVYQEKYAPICSTSMPSNPNKWIWSETPSPWEVDT